MKNCENVLIFAQNIDHGYTLEQSNQRSAMHAASQLPGGEPTDVDDVP